MRTIFITIKTHQVPRMDMYFPLILLEEIPDNFYLINFLLNCTDLINFEGPLCWRQPTLI